MRQIVGFGDRSTGMGTFEGEFRSAIVTNGDFAAYVCDSAATRPSFQITSSRRSPLPKLLWADLLLLGRVALVRYTAG